jgi:quercetin dioxygenase-like cupin family protein
MDELNRRNFAGMLASLLGAVTLAATNTEGQATSAATVGSAPAARPTKQLTSGVFKPQAGKGMQGGHESHQFGAGMLTAGNIRLEMHESVQQPGAPHEAVGTHKHSEIWLMQRGVATLYLNGTEHTLETGDVGLCCAGDEHWIANKGDTELAYFVVTVGSPE